MGAEVSVPEDEHPGVDAILQKFPFMEQYTNQLIMLEKHDQLHLVKTAWDFSQKDRIDGFFKQLEHLNAGYPGGLPKYITNAKELLLQNKNQENPFKGFTPEIPTGNTIQYGSEDFLRMEEAGLGVSHQVGFVLVAGGLGERLGYNGIKISLSPEITTGRCYIQLYIESILALQREASRRTGTDVVIPFAIMTSGDTHARTAKLLADSSNFGMVADQITLLQQEKVASLADEDAHLVADKEDPYKLETKPHGHGDVHTLMSNSGTAGKWLASGIQFIGFLQDTNALVFRSMIASFGVSSTEQLDCNSMTGPREPKREMGAIMRLKRADGTSITNNVEYSMLDALLIATGSPDGDVAGTDGSGLSPYPGNMNQLIFKLDNYIKSLESEEPGVAKTCPEFVNPKYKDATRTGFKKPTRLECMMQDLPRLFDDGAKVGFTTIMGNGLTAEREAAIAASWGAGTDAALIKSRISFYSPVKNNVKDAAGKQRKGQVPGCAAVGETDVYAAHCKVLLALGCNIGAPLPRTYGEGDEAITANDWPHISIAPALCLTTATLQEVFPTPGQVVVASGSTLVLDGPGKVIIESLELDGALRVTAEHPDSVVRIRGLKVKNGGCRFVPIDSDEPVEMLQIRGYKHVEDEVLEYKISDPHTVTIESS